MATEAEIRARFEVLGTVLNERDRRLLAGAEAKVIGRGGIAAVSRATGLSKQAVIRGVKDLDDDEFMSGAAEGRIRRPGAGRKPATEKDPELLAALESLVEPVTRGDPESPLRWTSKSLRKLAEELTEMGHAVGHVLVRRLLRSLGYSLQANRKTREGTEHPDRDAQFNYLNGLVKEVQGDGNPVVSVDTKKKELVGDFKNGGREYRPKKTPEEVRVHDFKDSDLGKVNPYGVYDLADNSAWVSVGIDHDTAGFAVATIRRWWLEMGEERYPGATELMITADCGGSNGYRIRLWKTELQKLADELKIPITVSHYPPGTSKWNKIEHRLFSFITMNWRAKPLVTRAVIVSLIAATTTTAGLRVRAGLDMASYEKGLKVSDAELEKVNILPHHFHGEWNYTIFPVGDP